MWAKLSDELVPAGSLMGLFSNESQPPEEIMTVASVAGTERRSTSVSKV